MMFKEFLALLNAFRTFVVQQSKTMSQNNEIAKIMGQILKSLGVTGIIPNGVFVNLNLRQGCWTPLKGRKQG